MYYYYIATTHYKSTTRSLKKESEDEGGRGRQKAQKHKSLFSLCLSLFYFPFGNQMASGHHHPQREREKEIRKNCRAHFFFGLATWHDEEIDGLEKNIFWLVDSSAFTHAHMQSFRTSLLLHCWKFYSNWNTQTKHSHSSNGCGWTRSHSPHLSVCVDHHFSSSSYFE